MVFIILLISVLPRMNLCLLPQFIKYHKEGNDSNSKLYFVHIRQMNSAALLLPGAVHIKQKTEAKTKTCYC
uniref:Secreted protein n=1 Tax=Rhizophora mucronata TaxID=61149 RepID=A0A2P2JLY7_RHIMU